MNNKLEQSLDSLERAVSRLEEALSEKIDNTLFIDGTIQRFEFAIGLFWKTFRRALHIEGVETATPKEAISQAYQSGWFDNDAIWLGMLKDRNETSHIYDEGKANEIYSRIGPYTQEMRKTLEFLKQRFQ
jgi:nucleotidyltransferase substrate binding protein (TIGR01987 family)